MLKAGSEIKLVSIFEAIFSLSFTRRLARHRVRCSMRGFRKLRREGQLNFLSAVMAALTVNRVDVGPRRVWLMGSSPSFELEISYRQYLLTRVMGPRWLNSSILSSLGGGGSIKHPLPREWRTLLKKHGLRVSSAWSTVSWWLYVMVFWVYGCAVIVQMVYHSLRIGSSQNAWADAVPYVHFVGLAKGNTPRLGPDGKSFDVMTWYSQWSGRQQNVSNLTHCVGKTPPDGGSFVKFLPADLTPIPRIVLSRFLAWGLAAAAYTLLEAFRGRWAYAVMLSEFARAAGVRFSRSPPLAKEYLFHGSGVAYRPIWTYEAEECGAAITMYFYSTNSESFRLKEGYVTPLHTWQTMTWSRLLVWDQAQANFMREAIGGRAKIEIVGPVWFQSSPELMPQVPAGAIAVFDVPPQRTSRRQSLATPHEYYSPCTSETFLSDIIKVAAEFGRPVVFKRKRPLTSIVHRRYLSFIDNLESSNQIIMVDPEISAVRVIESCQVVLSMAFTSTALLAHALARPSVYYDPAIFLQTDDKASHGISVVQGIDQLREWFRNLR